MRLKSSIFYFVLAALVLWISGTTNAQDEREESLISQSHAKGTLLSLGSSDLAYQMTNDDRLFGTFEDMQEDLYIAEGYGYSTMIENYELRTFMEPDKTGFTFIAFPTAEMDPALKIYAIDETQRLYSLTPGDGPGNRVPGSQGAIRTRTDESPQLDAPESITVHFYAMDNWTHNIYPKYIYVESMDQWYLTRDTFF